MSSEQTDLEICSAATRKVLGHGDCIHLKQLLKVLNLKLK